MSSPDGSRLVVVVLAAIALAAASCGGGQQAPALDVSDIRSVCLTVDADVDTDRDISAYDDYGNRPAHIEGWINQLQALPAGVEQWLKDVLAQMDIAVVEDGCDAVLAAELDAEAICPWYTGMGTEAGFCCTGGRASGTLSLMADGFQSREAAIDFEQEPPAGDITRCPGPLSQLQPILNDQLAAAFVSLWGPLAESAIQESTADVAPTR